jgi:hypothetical protein
MDIAGKLKGIKYKKVIGKDLNKFSLEKFDINSTSLTSLIFDKQNLTCNIKMGFSKKNSISI